MPQENCEICGGWGRCPHCPGDPGTKKNGSECECYTRRGSLGAGVCGACYGSGVKAPRDEKTEKPTDWDDEMKKLMKGGDRSSR
mgnify:CR=1 FL=1